MKIIVSLMAVTLLLTLGGVSAVMADDEPQTNGIGLDGFFTRLAEKLGISEQELKDAFTEVKDELRAEHAGQCAEMPINEALEGIGVTPEAFRDAYVQAMRELKEDMPEKSEFKVVLMVRVAEILGVEQVALEDALAQAKGARGEVTGKRFGRGKVFGRFNRGHIAPPFWGGPAPQSG